LCNEALYPYSVDVEVSIILILLATRTLKQDFGAAEVNANSKRLGILANTFAPTQ